MPAKPKTELPSRDAEAPISVLAELTPLQLAEAKRDEAESRALELTKELAHLRTALAAETAKTAGLSARLGELESNPLLFALSNIDAGSVLHEAGESLTELTKACAKLQEPGALTVKLKLKMEKGVFIFVPEISAKTPKAELARGIFFTDGDGKLFREDPRQRELNYDRRKS